MEGLFPTFSVNLLGTLFFLLVNQSILDSLDASIAVASRGESSIGKAGSHQMVQNSASHALGPFHSDCPPRMLLPCLPSLRFEFKVFLPFRLLGQIVHLHSHRNVSAFTASNPEPGLPVQSSLHFSHGPMQTADTSSMEVQGSGPALFL